MAIIENLRKLSRSYREGVDKAAEIAERIKKEHEAARKATGKKEG